MPFRLIQSFICLCFIAFFPPGALAHNQGQSFTSLSFGYHTLDGQTDIYLDDLAQDLSVDQNQDKKISADEIEKQHAALSDYFKKNMQLQINHQPAEIIPSSFTINGKPPFYSLHAEWSAPHTIDQPQSLHIKILFLFEKNPDFTSLVSLKQGEKSKSTVLTKERPDAELFLSGGREFAAFVRYGLEHIWEGLDHIFFVVLLIFSVFLSGQRKNSLHKNFTDQFINMIKLATAFTIAHSLTLGLSVLDIYAMPSQVVESLILISIIFVGLDNIFQFYKGRQWIIVFSFGLFHGLGFADALKELGLSAQNIALPLAGFNVGVEIGQIVIIGILLPGIYFLNRRWEKTPKLLIGVCWLIIAVTSLWLVERLFLQKGI